MERDMAYKTAHLAALLGVSVTRSRREGQVLLGTGRHAVWEGVKWTCRCHGEPAGAVITGQAHRAQHT